MISTYHYHFKVQCLSNSIPAISLLNDVFIVSMLNIIKVPVFLNLTMIRPFSSMMKMPRFGDFNLTDLRNMPHSTLNHVTSTTFCDWTMENVLRCGERESSPWWTLSFSAAEESLMARRKTLQLQRLSLKLCEKRSGQKTVPVENAAEKTLEYIPGFTWRDESS